MRDPLCKCGHPASDHNEDVGCCGQLDVPNELRTYEYCQCRLSELEVWDAYVDVLQRRLDVHG